MADTQMFMFTELEQGVQKRDAGMRKSDGKGEHMWCRKIIRG